MVRGGFTSGGGGSTSDTTDEEEQRDTQLTAGTGDADQTTTEQDADTDSGTSGTSSGPGFSGGGLSAGTGGGSTSGGSPDPDRIAPDDTQVTRSTGDADEVQRDADSATKASQDTTRVNTDEIQNELEGSIGQDPAVRSMQGAERDLSNEVQGQAQDFETQVIRGTDLNREDVRIRRRGDKLLAELTGAGVTAQRRRFERRLRSRVSSIDVGGPGGGAGAVRTQSPRQQAEQSIEQQLEADVGVDITSEDIAFEREGNKIVGRLSESGQKKVAVESAPFQNTPVEGVFEAGAAIDYEFDEFRAKNREAFYGGIESATDVSKVLPNSPVDPIADAARFGRASVLFSEDRTPGEAAAAVAAAGAPAAVVEPTPLGEIGVAGAAGVAGLTVAGVGAAQSVSKGAPQAEAESELREEPMPTSEITVDEEAARGQQREIDVPENAESFRVTELGIAEEDVQSGEISVDGSTMDEETGEIPVPQGADSFVIRAVPATAVGVVEGEEAEEEEDVEEEERVVVEVPEEMIPEETVTIGSVEESTSEVDEDAEATDREVEEEAREQEEQLFRDAFVEPEETQATGDLTDRPTQKEVQQSQVQQVEEVQDLDQTFQTIRSDADIQSVTPGAMGREAQQASVDVAAGDLIGEAELDLQSELAATRTAQDQALGLQQLNVTAEMNMAENVTVEEFAEPTETVTEDVTYEYPGVAGVAPGTGRGVDIRLPSLDSEGGDAGKRRRGGMFTREFENPVATPGSILSGEALDLDGVDASLEEVK